MRNIIDWLVGWREGQTVLSNFVWETFGGEYLALSGYASFLVAFCVGLVFWGIERIGRSKNWLKDWIKDLSQDNPMILVGMMLSLFVTSFLGIHKLPYAHVPLELQYLLVWILYPFAMVYGSLAFLGLLNTEQIRSHINSREIGNDALSYPGWFVSVLLLVLFFVLRPKGEEHLQERLDATIPVIELDSNETKLIKYMRDSTGGFANSTDEFSLSVLVLWKEGKDERILTNGKVILDIGGNLIEEEINSEGVAIFPELRKDYFGKSALIALDHPQPYKPTERNKEFILKQGQFILFEVELPVYIMSGDVIDSKTGKRMDSVRVSYRNKFTYSNKLGSFELEIPYAIKVEMIDVRFYKPGYEDKIVKALMLQPKIVVPLSPDSTQSYP